MMYYKKSVVVGDRVFITKCKMAMYGNSKKRTKRLKPTSEAIKKHNILKAIDMVYWLLLLNFKPGDLHIVFTYMPGLVQSIPEAKEKFSKFLRVYRDYCKKNNLKCDYIYNTEIGKDGAIHHHCILHNYGDEYQIEQMWEHGSTQRKKSYLWSNYDWYGLAYYFVDKTKGGKLPDTHVPGERRYVPSKGLIRPEIKIEKVEAERWNKPKAPKGYIIESDSIRTGTHELTGGSFIKYTMRRVI